MRALRLAACISIAVTCMTFSGRNWAACLDSGVQVQILGSGGPGPSAGRASAGYVVWIVRVSRSAATRTGQILRSSNLSRALMFSFLQR